MGHIVMDVLNSYKVTESSRLINDSTDSVGMLCKAPGEDEPRPTKKPETYPKRLLPTRKNGQQKPVADVGEFAWECTKYIDRHGQILGKESNPMTSYLEMRGQNDEVDSQFMAFSAFQGNGSWNIRIWRKLPDGSKELVLRASSDLFTVRPYDIKVIKYVPGDWEMNFYE